MRCRACGWSRTEAIIFTLFVVGLLLSLFVLVHPWYDLKNDASLYIVTARAIADGEGYSYLGEPFLIRPPGFSTMLAPFVRGSTIDFRLLNLLTSLFGVAAVVLLYLFQRTRVGFPLALATAVAVWLNPGFQRLCNQTLSDVPGLALLLAALLVERWARQRPSFRRELALGLTIGIACYVRPATILLLPAIVVSRLYRRWRRPESTLGFLRFGLERLVPFALAAWLILLPWSLYQREKLPTTAVDQTLNHSLSTAMWHEDPGDPGSPRLGPGRILERLPQNAGPVGAVIGSRLLQRFPDEALPEGTARWLGWVFALLLLSGLGVVLVRRGSPAELFAAGSLIVVAFYFVFTDRLVLSVYVLALAATVETLREVVRRTPARPVADAVVGSLLLLVALFDFAPGHDRERIRAQHLELATQASEIVQVLPPDARLASAQGFHHSVYLDRPVHSLIHAVRRAGRAEAVEPIIDRYGINTVVLSSSVQQDTLLVPYFRRRYGAGASVAGATIWRVRP